MGEVFLGLNYFNADDPSNISIRTKSESTKYISTFDIPSRMISQLIKIFG
jgi:hypothetical protein